MLSLKELASGRDLYTLICVTKEASVDGGVRSRSLHPTAAGPPGVGSSTWQLGDLGELIISLGHALTC